MEKRILITGGAGFIGAHLALELLHHGYRVRALDRLDEQVHGDGGVRPAYLPDDVELIVGDVRDRDAVRRALDGVDAVYHFASLVGVGQSMYAIRRYTDVNDVGTATVLEALVERPVERLVVASSMSVYGEGRYRDEDGGVHDHVERDPEALKRRAWDPVGEHGEPLVPVPTPEDKPPALASVYALNKYVQERSCLIVGRAYDIPTVALRFFNVYGPHQALSNPYTGVLAIFASRLLNGKAPLVFEDGRQRRDFVHVEDVARACRLALETPEAAHGVFNVGSGHAVTIAEVAQRLAAVLGSDVEAESGGGFRAGDVRHCFADLARSQRVLGFDPRVSLDEGLRDLAAWLEGQVAVDGVEQARQELVARGLAT